MGLYTALLHAGADTFGWPRDRLKIRSWDVVGNRSGENGEEEKGFPALGDVDAVLVSGSREFLFCVFFWGFSGWTEEWGSFLPREMDAASFPVTCQGYIHIHTHIQIHLSIHTTQTNHPQNRRIQRLRDRPMAAAPAGIRPRCARTNPRAPARRVFRAAGHRARDGRHGGAECARVRGFRVRGAVDGEGEGVV